jgi:hypothetical protein
VPIGTPDAITDLTGDVTATGPGSVAATVVSVGGKTSAEIAQSVDDTQDATSLNVFNTIVKRDGSGNIFATNLTGTNTGDVTVTDTDSIDLTITGQNLQSDLRLSTDPADAGNVKASSTVHSGPGAGLHVQTPYGTPVQIGTSNFDGAASSFALSDHVHNHGSQTSPTLHALATPSAHGFMSSTDKTKVNNFILNTVTLIDGPTISTDASLSNFFTVTLGGNRTLAAPTNPTEGQKITYRFRQDGTGNRTLTFDPIFRFGIDLYPTVLSTGANKTDYIGCIYNSTDSTWDIVAVSKGF